MTNGGVGIVRCSERRGFECYPDALRGIVQREVCEPSAANACANAALEALRLDLSVLIGSGARQRPTGSIFERGVADVQSVEDVRK